MLQHFYDLQVYVLFYTEVILTRKIEKLCQPRAPNTRHVCRVFLQQPEVSECNTSIVLLALSSALGNNMRDESTTAVGVLGPFSKLRDPHKHSVHFGIKQLLRIHRWVPFQTMADWDDKFISSQPLVW